MDYIRTLVSRTLVGAITWGFSQMNLDSNDFNQNHRSLYGPSNDTYVPNDMVKTGAQLGMGGWLYPNVLPNSAIACLILGIVAMVFVNLAFLLRCCCRCCTLGPKDPEDASYSEEDAKKATATGFRLYIVVFVFIGIVCLTDMIVYVGNGYFDKGVVVAQDTLDTLSTIFSELMDAGYTISMGVSTMSDSSNNINCLPTGTIPSSELASISSSINDFLDKASPVSDMFDMAGGYVTLYGQQYRTYALYGLWGVILFVVLLFLLANICKSKCFMKFALVVGVIIYYITVIITCPWMVLSAALGVFCLDPIDSIRRAVKADLIDFYTSCNADVPGQDILGESVASVIDSFDIIKAALNTNVTYNGNTYNADDYCRGNVNGGPAADTYYPTFVDVGLEGVSDGLYDVQAAIRCSRIRDMIYEFVGEGLCVNIYGGIYSIWASQFTTGFFMFFLIILASVAYQYYQIASPPVAPAGDNNIPHNPYVQAPQQAVYEMVPTGHVESGVSEEYAKRESAEV